MADEYHVAAKLSQPPEKALDLAKQVLAANGFRFETQSEDSLVAIGPGLRSTRQNPLLGATRIVLKVAQQHLALDADLNGVRTLQGFVRWFPLGLGLILGVSLGVVQGFIFGAQTGVGFGVPWASGWKWMAFAMIGSLVPVSPWLVLSPIIGRSIEKRTKSALDTLVVNSAG